MESLVLIDAYGHIYRAFYGLRSLTNAQGQPANALFAMARFLLSLEESLPSTFGAVVFDKGKCTRRCALLPQYKAQRPPMPEELRSQIPAIRDWLQAFGWPLLEQEGREADDLMAALAVSAPEDIAVDILSFDKDLAQLVNGHVKILTPGQKGQWNSLDVDGVRAKYGLEPQQLCDYLSLLGDSADNIPGVEGVGPKTATTLLQSFGSLEGIRQNLDKVSGQKLRASLTAATETLERNRQLVALDTELPDDWHWAVVCQRRQPDWKLLCHLAEEQGFKSLLPQFQRRLAAAPESEHLLGDLPLFAAAKPQKTPPPEDNGQLLLF